VNVNDRRLAKECTNSWRHFDRATNCCDVMTKFMYIRSMELVSHPPLGLPHIEVAPSFVCTRRTNRTNCFTLNLFW